MFTLVVYVIASFRLCMFKKFLLSKTPNTNQFLKEIVILLIRICCRVETYIQSPNICTSRLACLIFGGRMPGGPGSERGSCRLLKALES